VDIPVKTQKCVVRNKRRKIKRKQGKLRGIRNAQINNKKQNGDRKKNKTV
jgi:hypothetical protein